MIIKNDNKNKIVEILEQYIYEKEKLSFNNTTSNEFLDFGTTVYAEKTRAIIKVQDGCNNFCSYCIIPYARGTIRSREVEKVITEIKEITKQGIQEIVITGIHLASYGKDFKEDVKLIDLLEKINKIENLKRIRLGSLEPNIITEEFINRLKKLDKICNHFHLSLQSGCNETLKRMNRKYTVEEFEKAVKLLRENFEGVAITTDIIVGFPGETEQEFNKTYKFLENINFSKMHIFKYSQRKGTRAAIMENQIDGSIKELRSRKLIELSNKNEKEFLLNHFNKQVKVLFEQKEGEFYKGHTKNYIIVKAKGKKLENKIIEVKINNIEDLELVGEVIKGK